MIPVIDSLEAALALTEQTADAWKEGVEATVRQLNTAFERNLLKAVAPAEGDKFDPHVHQAISAIPSALPEGTVAQLLHKGYTIAERVLRPALALVSSGQASLKAGVFRLTPSFFTFKRSMFRGHNKHPHGLYCNCKTDPHLKF